MTAKEKKAEYDRAYLAANRDKIRTRQREWYAKNKDKISHIRRTDVTSKAKKRIYDKKYYTTNRDHQLVLRRNYYQANREAMLARQKRYNVENKEHKLERDRAYRNRSGHKEKTRSYNREYRKLNPEKHTTHTANRRARKRGATPRWLTKKQLQRIEAIYEAARLLSERSVLEMYEVDHIVPLQGRRICGLHVPWNLQILTHEENCDKLNYLPPADQLVDYSAKGYAGVRAKLKRKSEQ